jgi:hypothetical protein
MFFIFLSYYVFDEYSLVLILNRISKRLKSVTKKLFGGKSRVGTADTLFQGCSTASSRRAEMMKHMDLSLVGRAEVFFFIFIPFYNMNLLISLPSIFQDEESLGWEEEVEVAGLLKESLRQQVKEMRRRDEAMRQRDDFYAQAFAQQQMTPQVSLLNYFICYRALSNTFKTNSLLYNMYSKWYSSKKFKCRSSNLPHHYLTLGRLLELRYVSYH